MTSRSWPALPLMLALALAAPVAARADESSASAHFERGVAFTKDKDYVAAMVEFKKAYALDPAPMVLFNIGQTANELKDYAGALRSYEQYLKDAGAEVDEERRKKVQSLIDELREKTANIGIEVNVVGAAVAVDDVDVGVTPLASAVLMNAGRRKISISKSGYEPLTRFIEIAGTEQKKLAFEIVSLSAGGPPPPPGGDAPPTEELEHTPWPWIGLAATAAAGIATGVVGGLAVSKHSEYEDALATVPTSKDRIEDARSAARSMALATDVLLGITLGGAALTALAFGLDYGRSAPAAEATVSWTPIVGPGFLGVTGAF